MRLVKKTGDIFSVAIGAGKQKFFQFIGRDLIQLNSDVIVVFKEVYSMEAAVDLKTVLNGEVDFVAHTMVSAGCKMNLWTKAGNPGSVKQADTLFRDSTDYGSRPGEQVDISEKWFVWKMHDTAFQFVGDLKGAHRDAEIGIVVNPHSIFTRIVTGAYDFRYPGFK